MDGYFQVTHLLAAGATLYESLNMSLHIFPSYSVGAILVFLENALYGALHTMVSHKFIVVFGNNCLFIRWDLIFGEPQDGIYRISFRRSGEAKSNAVGRPQDVRERLVHPQDSFFRHSL
jgi:hypothetical protein